MTIDRHWQYKKYATHNAVREVALAFRLAMNNKTGVWRAQQSCLHILSTCVTSAAAAAPVELCQKANAASGTP